MIIYGFWNNKGGTGKTSLCFQAACAYAYGHPAERVLIVDVCPQANLSEMFLGRVHKGSQKLLARQGDTLRATIGGYFQRAYQLRTARRVRSSRLHHQPCGLQRRDPGQH